jgi:hypothetical protein
MNPRFFILSVTILVRFFGVVRIKIRNPINDRSCRGLTTFGTGERMVDARLHFDTRAPLVSFSLDVVLGFRKFGRAKIKVADTMLGFGHPVNQRK